MSKKKPEALKEKDKRWPILRIKKKPNYDIGYLQTDIRSAVEYAIDKLHHTSGNVEDILYEAFEDVMRK